MFGLEFSHILVLAAIALIVLGPKQMPQLARILGKTIGELRKAMREVSSQISIDLEDEKPSKKSETSTKVSKDQT